MTEERTEQSVLKSFNLVYKNLLNQVASICTCIRCKSQLRKCRAVVNKQFIFSDVTFHNQSREFST